MNNVSLYWQILCNRIRFVFIKLINPSAHITVHGSTLVSADADVEVANNSLLQIGRGLHVRKNAVLAVRERAELTIGNGAFINRNTIIMARKSISIGNGVTIGPNVCIYDHDHDVLNKGKYITGTVAIGNNAWIGSNVTILKGVKIGEGAVIASGSIVTKEVPAHTILIQKKDSIYKSLENAEL